MPSFLIPAHAKDTAWRFFPEECVDTHFELKQPYSNYHRSTVADMIEEAAQERAPFDAFGQKFAHHLQGQFLLGPNKTHESAVASLLRNNNDLLPQYADREGSGLTDYLRGAILVEDNHGIVRARKKLRDIVDHEQSTIIQIKDRTSRPPHNGMRGIFVHVATPAGHIAEIQIHTRAYWEAFATTRDAFEKHRAFNLTESLHYRKLVTEREAWMQGETPPAIREEWNDEARAQSRRARSTRYAGLEEIAKTTKINALELSGKNYEGDCSFPLRPAVVSGQKGFAIAEEHLGKYIKENYPYWDPTWHPSQGKRAPE